MWCRGVSAIVEAIALGERGKPIQRCIRRSFVRYGISGSNIDSKASAIVYNVFRSLGLVDHILKSLNVKVEDLEPHVKSALRLMTYIYHLDDNSSRNFKKLIRMCVMRFLRRERADNYLQTLNTIVKAHWKPKSFEERVMYEYRVSPTLYNILSEAFRMLGENLEEYLTFTLKPQPRTFRVNTLKCSVSDIVKKLKSLKLNVHTGRYCSNAIILESPLNRHVVKLIEDGTLIPQDEASIIAVDLLDPKEGMEVADLCAAPGGKTTYIVEKTRLNVKVYSFEIFKDRAERLRRMLKRTGTDSAVKVYVMDARRALDVLGVECVDRVLLDPPCSSTGAMAKNPDVRWRSDLKSITELTKLQRELLDVGFKLLKRNGILLYTTCSVLPCEGEHVILDFIGGRSDVEVLDLGKPFKRSPILRKTMRSWPHIHKTTGFYYALLRKV